MKIQASPAMAGMKEVSQYRRDGMFAQEMQNAISKIADPSAQAKPAMLGAGGNFYHLQLDAMGMQHSSLAQKMLSGEELQYFQSLFLKN